MAMGYFCPLATTAPLPSRWETIGTFFFCLAVEEVGFFYVHRLFHSPRFYKSVHKLHHSSSPFSSSSSSSSSLSHSHVLVTYSVHCTRRFGIDILHGHRTLLLQPSPYRPRYPLPPFSRTSSSSLPTDSNLSLTQVGSGLEYVDVLLFPRTSNSPNPLRTFPFPLSLPHDPS